MRIFTSKAALTCGVAVIALSCASAAWAQAKPFDVPSEDAVNSIPEFARQAGIQIVAPASHLEGMKTGAIKGNFEIRTGLNKLLRGTGLLVASSDDQTIILRAPRKNVVAAPTEKVAAASAGGQVASSDQAIAPEEVQVTGSRIVRNGYTAPTPVTVVSSQQLELSATGNIADAVNQFPALFGSQTPQNSGRGISTANAGINILNLRNLGGIRTLVLVDGQRSVGSLSTGVVDIDTIPQDLVTRVDIVTGGASAAYGSDALAGVVNFVLDKTFEGTKAELSGGVTSYGDGWNYRLRLTEGISFGGGRGHLIISGEATNNNGVPGAKGVSTNNPNGTPARPWNSQGAAIINNPAYTATNGQPQYISVLHSSIYTAAYGGTIDSTALAGTTFGPGGTPRAIQFGSIVASPNQVGGDWLSLQANNVLALDPSLVSNRIFGRASYEITDNINVFGQFSWAGARAKGADAPIIYLGNLTVQADNAFIPASVAARAKALGISSFAFGSLNGDLDTTNPWAVNAYRSTRRAVIGADGKFEAFGSNWSWNGYYQDGRTESEFQALGLTYTPNYMKAIDAVTSPATGAIVCRSTLTNPTNGCVPYNLFGAGVNSQAAINYVEPGHPAQHMNLEEQVWSGAINGEPFSNWAGAVSVALGVEHRSEALNADADPLHGGWYAANYVPVSGHYSVTEGFFETVVPLARDMSFAKAIDVNAAVRATDYSTAGFVTTWKIGATWDVTSDLRLRATRSRDIRAPNLSELFQTASGGTNTLNDDFHGRALVLNTGVQTGNTNLKPETSDGTGIGFVFRPTFLENFNFSADYWEDDIKGAIALISNQQVIDLCYQGFKSVCSQMTPDLSTLSATPANITIVNQPVNLASQTAEGIDLESDYRVALGDLVAGWGGNVDFRYVATHYITNVTNNNLTPPAQSVGASLPKWRHNISVVYTDDRYTVALTGRLTSAGVQNLNYIQCSTGCPTATTNNPTVDSDHQPGSFYLDTAMSYNFSGPYSSDMQFFVNIQNILNADPGLIPQFTPTFQLPQTNPTLYDMLGRTFRIGIRARL